MVVRVEELVDRPFLGKVVRLTSLSVRNDYDETVWGYEEPLLLDTNGREALGFPDEYLRPIRGDEGTDETLLWKPLPLPQIEKVGA